MANSISCGPPHVRPVWALGTARVVSLAAQRNAREWSTRFRVALLTCAPCGTSVRVVPDRPTESRKIPPRKTVVTLPLFILAVEPHAVEGARGEVRAEGRGGGGVQRRDVLLLLAQAVLLPVPARG